MLARCVIVVLCALAWGCSSPALVRPLAVRPADLSSLGEPSPWGAAAPAHDYGDYDDPFQTEVDHVRVGAEFGQRTYSNANWNQVGTPSVIGVTGSHEPPEWPVGMDLGLYCITDSGDLGGTRLDLIAWEGYAGIMKSVDLFEGLLVLHGGAGAAVTYLETDPDDRILAREDATWTSGYARVGLTVHISPKFEFGFALRGARGGSFRIAGAELDGDYEQAAFSLSASW